MNSRYNKAISGLFGSVLAFLGVLGVGTPIWMTPELTAGLAGIFATLLMAFGPANAPPKELKA